MNLAHKLFVWLNKRKSASLRTVGWLIVIGNVYIATTLPFFPFVTNCFDSGIIWFYSNFHYRYLSIFAEGPISTSYPYTALFHSMPNPLSSTVVANKAPDLPPNPVKPEMTILVPLVSWFDSSYMNNSISYIVSVIVEEDSGKTWLDFEDEVALLFSEYDLKSICAAYHIVITEGRVPNEEDIRRERRKLYNYIKSFR